MKLFKTGGAGFAGGVLLDLLPQKVRYSRLTVFVLPHDLCEARIRRRNIGYLELVHVSSEGAIGEYFNRPVYPFRVSAFLLALLGKGMELFSKITGKRSLLTYSYGRLSGWVSYYTNRKSGQAIQHEYLPFEKTMADNCRCFGELLLT